MILRFMEGPRSGKSVTISADDYTMGRDDSCDLLLDKDGVSRVHCRIKKDADDYVLHDNGSTNGVYINGEKLENPHTLKENDTIRISNYLMLFTSNENLMDTEAMAILDNIRQKKAGDAAGDIDKAAETVPPKESIMDDDRKAEEPFTKKETDDDVVFDFSKKADKTPKNPDPATESLLSGSTGIMVLVVIVLSLILLYIIFTGQ